MLKELAATNSFMSFSAGIYYTKVISMSKDVDNHIEYEFVNNVKVIYPFLVIHMIIWKFV